MTVRQAIFEGLRLLGANKRTIFWLYLVSLAAALVPAAVVSGAIRESVEKSEAAQRLKEGFDDEWYREFRVRARGLPATFEPAVSGFGPVATAADAWLSGRLFRWNAGILGLGVLFVLVWIYFNGGILAAFASSKGTLSGPEFAAAGAHYFWRFVRLAGFSSLLYLVIYLYLARGLNRVIETATRQVIDERIAFAWVLLKFALVGASLLLVNLVFDYAKIVTVLERRQGVLGSIWRAAGLVRNRCGRILLLYLSVLSIGVLIVLAFWLVAPGAGQSSIPGLIVALLIGQLLILARIWLRLLFLGSQTVLCESIIAAEGPR